MDAVRQKVGILEQEPETSTSGRVRAPLSVTEDHSPFDMHRYQGAHMRGSMHCLQGSGMHNYRRAASLALAACLHRDCSA